MTEKMRIADIIADFLAEHEMDTCFMITGGGAMHLDDAIGHHPGIRCVFDHQEQGCSVAAEGFARVTNRPAAVCVTSGPGGTNAITGVMGAWLDSIPMFVISGQVKRETTIWSCPSVPIRQLGDQEFDIIHSVDNMTKYAVMVTEPREILWHLEKAYARAVSGRPGPVWIDVPLDIQGAVVDADELIHWGLDNEAIITSPVTADIVEAPAGEADEKVIGEVLAKIREAEAPLILAGTGIHLAGAEDLLAAVLDKLKIPAVTAWNANDLVPFDSPWFAGMPGTVGTRAGNFAVQNCDLLLSLGCRMNIRMVGYTPFDFGKNAYKIAVDIDEAELKKPTLKIDLPVHGDVRDFLEKFLVALEAEGESVPDHDRWVNWCRGNVDKYPALAEIGREAAFAGESAFAGDQPDRVNPYRFIDALFEKLGPEETVVCSNGSACVVTFQAAKVKAGQRMFTNSGCASMGYGLPAAIGAAAAADRRVICLEGDGSIMMNLQELATVRRNDMDLRIFVLNNNGYHSIRQTQTHHFRPPFVGIDPESGVGFPDFGQIASAFGLAYVRIDSERDMGEKIASAVDGTGPLLCEVMIDPEQEFVPKTSSRVLPDGQIVSPVLEDMAPFIQVETFPRRKDDEEGWE